MQKLSTFWRNSAKKNWETAQSLFQLKHYDMCLFCCHLALEKLLKAIVGERTDKEPPFIHDLNRLAQLANLAISPKEEKWLNEITKFNIQARYDDIKRAFYKKATMQFTLKYLNITKELLLWLKKESQKQLLKKAKN